jgi:hypothetical protein
MSVRFDSLSFDSLPDGRLLTFRIAVAPAALERLLEVLAGTRFPINPGIEHHTGTSPFTLVEFPGYQSWVDELGAILRSAGFPFDFA